mgnify:CR=1 FL=1
MSKALKGTLFTVIAGIAWGLSGTSGQYLMTHGISALVDQYPFDNRWITLGSFGLY